MGIPFGFVIVLVAAIPLLNYFFEIIEFRALGKRGWPVLSFETLFALRNQLSLVFSAIAILAVLIRQTFVAIGLAAIGDLFGMFVLFAMPVSVAVLAVTRELSKSVNPVFLLRTVVRLELGYLGILLLSALWWLVARSAWISGAFLLMLVATMALLVLGYGIGSIVFFYRRKLGLETARAPEAKAAAARAQSIKEREDVLTTAWSFASRGNLKGAIALVREHAQSESDPFEAETWMFNRMSRWQDCSAALRYGVELSKRLAGADRPRDAAKVEVMCDAMQRAAQRTHID